MLRMLRKLIPAAAALFVASAVRAQVPAALTGDSPLYEPGKNVTITLLTMGNGEAVWEMFGHTAIMIRSDRTGRDTVFNWGAFNMRAPHFILHFLQGLN